MTIETLKQKKSWEPFRICLLNSTANSANFHPKWAHPISKSQDFFLFDISIFIYFSKYETIETHARALNI